MVFFRQIPTAIGINRNHIRACDEICLTKNDGNYFIQRLPALAFAPVPALPSLLSATADKGVQVRKRGGKGGLTASFFQ